MNECSHFCCCLSQCLTFTVNLFSSVWDFISDGRESTGVDFALRGTIGQMLSAKVSNSLELDTSAWLCSLALS